MRRRGRFVVSGRVQGVCYRMYACSEAARLGLRGWVRNRPDGTVEAVAEGDPEAVRAFRDWCRRGPPSAAVDSMTEEYGPAGGEFDSFRITW